MQHTQKFKKSLCLKKKIKYTNLIVLFVCLLLFKGYESLVCAVIRPPRSRYTQSDLGPKVVKLDSGVEMERSDFVLPNHQQMNLQCSMWTPRNQESVSCVVVYLHGNSSCRVDATRTGVLETVGPIGAALVSIDFAG
jgi:hypothetical protein